MCAAVRIALCVRVWGALAGAVHGAVCACVCLHACGVLLDVCVQSGWSLRSCRALCVCGCGNTGRIVAQWLAAVLDGHWRVRSCCLALWCCVVTAWGPCVAQAWCVRVSVLYARLNECGRVVCSACVCAVYALTSVEVGVAASAIGLNRVHTT